MNLTALDQAVRINTRENNSVSLSVEKDASINDVINGSNECQLPRLRKPLRE